MMAMAQIFPSIKNRKKSKSETCTLRAHVCAPWKTQCAASGQGSGLQIWWRGKVSSLSFQGVPPCIWWMWNYCPTCILTLNYFPTSLSSEGWTAFSQGFIFAIVLLFPLPGPGQTVSPAVETGASVCFSDSPRRGGCKCSQGRVSASLRSFLPHLGFADEGVQVCLWATVHSGHPHLLSSSCSDYQKDSVAILGKCCVFPGPGPGPGF